MGMFEKAARRKLRFSHKGQLSVEDLWDLPVEQLDAIYKKLAKEQKATEEESLLTKGPASFTILGLQIDIVKRIVTVKLEEEDARKTKALNKMKKERIASIIAEKEDEGLKSMSLDDLKKAMDEMS